MPAGLPPAGGRAGRRGPQGEDPRLRTVGVAARLHRLGLGVDVPRHRQARGRQRRPHPPRAAERLGRQRARASWRRCWPTLEAIQQEFAAQAARRHADLARRPDRAGRLRRRREGREGRRLRRRGALRPGTHGRDAGADRRRVVRRARADRGRVPQLPRARAGRSPPSTCSSTRRACSRSPHPR